MSLLEMSAVSLFRVGVGGFFGGGGGLPVVVFSPNLFSVFFSLLFVAGCFRFLP